MKNARARWESQSPFIQRAVPPLVIAALVILVMLPVRAPDPSGARPARDRVRPLRHAAAAWRRWALPATVLAFAIAYPLLIQQTNYQRFLFEVPIFNSFPSIDTMVVMAIFAMMAIGPEHGRRLRGPARPRLRRLLRASAPTRRPGSPRRTLAVHPRREADRRQFRRHRRDRGTSAASTSRSGSSSSPRRSSRPSAGSSSACRRCGCVATTSRSSRSASGRSSPQVARNGDSG